MRVANGCLLNMATCAAAFLAAATLLTKPLAAQPPSKNVLLKSAFVAVFGHSAPVLRQAERPGRVQEVSGDDWFWKPALTLTPLLLVQLGRDRYALLTREDDRGVGHAYRGAIAVAYLHRSRHGWEKDRLWPEFAWTGDTGVAADSASALPFGRPRLAVVTRTNLVNGEVITTGWVIELGADQPRLLGDIVVGDDLSGDDCTACTHCSFSGRIKPPTRRESVLSISYRGWVTPPGQHKPKTSFQAVTDYVPTPEGLSATSPVKLPCP